MKKTFKKAYAVAMLIGLTSHTAINAQSAEIYPVPQTIQWSQEVAFTNEATYTLTGEATADADAVNIFKKNFTTENGTVEVILGERGDEAVAAYENLIPQKREGYYLAIEKNKVVIAGNDGSGTFYGVQTFLQIAAQPNVMCVTISDFPSVAQRGLVEGYYGNPYSEADRMSLFEFFGRTKMNVYIYGPKDDAYHKSKWREEYPAAQAAKITEYVNAARANKVEFVWAIHPGNDIQWNRTDSVNIVNKLKSMYDLGVRTFAVFFDDVWGGEGTRGDKQAMLMNYITDELNNTYPDVNPCIICPTQYNKGWSSGDYLSTLGSTMNSTVRIMWTGNSVVDMINKSDMEWINNQISRKAYIWLNYPVTDYCINHLLMGPTYGNDLDIADMLSGFTSNPMEYAEASKVSLFSIADYNWNMPAYDADASWEAAIKFLMPGTQEAFRFFCQNNVDLGSTGHGLRRMNESPEFVAAKQVYDEKMSCGDKDAAFAAVGKQFEKFTTSADALMLSEEAPALISEITPWLECMKCMGLRGTELTNMHKALTEENPEKFIQSYERYVLYKEAQDAIRSRDFSGSLKSASPVVATLHVEPFIKETLGELVTEYRENYDYRLDVFPAQVVENGTYYIMYKGQYLTNHTPNVAGNYPMFTAEFDDIRPQRQEWKITIDPSTNRYKIINLEDGRYINENGSFSVSEQTNPYESAWHTYEILLLANGKYAIKNGGSAGTEFWGTGSRRVRKSGTSEALPEVFKFDIVALGEEPHSEFIEAEEIYYIMDGNKYLTNNNIKGSGGTPTFKEVAEPSAIQEWKIAADANGENCYKITSNADGRYMNELGVFGTNQYYSDWNTYLLTLMEDKWSIQCTQAATGDNRDNIKFLVVTGDRLEAKNIARNDSYTVSIKKKGDDTGIENIGATKNITVVNGAILADGNVESIELHSADGKLLKKSNSNTLSTAGIEKGMYIIVVTHRSGTTTHKVQL